MITYFLLSFSLHFSAKNQQNPLVPRDYAKYLRTSPKCISRISRIFVSMRLTKTSALNSRSDQKKAVAD